MKKKIFGGFAVLAIATVAVWNVSLGSQSSELSGISLANVEALAAGESGGSGCTSNSSRDHYYGQCPRGSYYSSYDYTICSFSCSGESGSCSGIQGKSGNDCSQSYGSGNLTSSTKSC